MQFLKQLEIILLTLAYLFLLYDFDYIFTKNCFNLIFFFVANGLNNKLFRTIFNFNYVY